MIPTNGIGPEMANKVFDLAGKILVALITVDHFSIDETSLEKIVDDAVLIAKLTNNYLKPEYGGNWQPSNAPSNPSKDPTKPQS